MCKLFYEAFLILHIMVTSELKKINSDNEKRQVDIINNISLANKALQELINNYEQLKKIYRSGEILQTQSLSESNEYFRVMADKKIGDNNTSTLRPATVGIYESLFNYDNSNSKDVTDEATNKVEPTENVTKNLWNESKANMKKGKDSTDEDSSGSLDSEDIEAIAIEMPLKQDIVISKPNTNAKNVLKMRTPEINQNILGEKTRFSVKRFGHQNESNEKSIEKIVTNSRRIKKVVYSETFSPNNIWQEIISKPMQLTKDTGNVPKINDNLQFLNNAKNQMTVVILTKDVMKDKNSLNGLVDFDSKERLLYKFQDTSLRSRYGDTCLHIPIKKCKKAISEVSKRVCKARFKCKSEFKSDFIKNGEIGCKKTFMYVILNDKEKKEKPLDEDEKIQPYVKQERDSFEHVKRDKINDIRHYNEEKGKTNIITLRNETPYYIKPIVLRNKYERECRKESRMKCTKACEYSTEVTCAEHSCSNKKESALRRSCKNECNKLFLVKKEKSSGSDSDDSSDSDSKSRSDKSDRSDRS